MKSMAGIVRIIELECLPELKETFAALPPIAKEINESQSTVQKKNQCRDHRCGLHPGDAISQRIQERCNGHCQQHRRDDQCCSQRKTAVDQDCSLKVRQERIVQEFWRHKNVTKRKI